MRVACHRSPTRFRASTCRPLHTTNEESLRKWSVAATLHSATLHPFVKSSAEKDMDVLQTLKSERDRAQRELNKLNAAIKALGGSTRGRVSTATTHPTLSAAARARIAAAQRARWAKVRGQKQNVVSMPKPKKTMSAAARRKIAAAQRARWAKVKAAKKARK